MKKQKNINSICFRAAFLPALVLVVLALTISGFLFKYHVDNIIKRELTRHELISQLFVKSANADIIIGNEHSLYIMIKEYIDSYQLQKLLITNQNQEIAPTFFSFLINKQVYSNWPVAGISPRQYISIQSKIDTNAIIIPLLSSSAIILLFIIASIVMFARIKQMLHAKIIQPLNQTLTCNGNDLKWFDKDNAATEVASLYQRTNEFIRTLHQQRDEIEASNIKQAKYDVALQMAHDIRSPVLALETISGMFGNLADEAKVMLLNVTKRISQIASDVLLENNISSDAATCTSNLVDVAKAIFNEKSLTCQNKSITFYFENRNLLQPIFVGMPEIILCRILSNLIDNAIESFEKSGQITMAITATLEKAIICIRDTGCGISANNMNTIFQKSRQSIKSNGNGLGLWSVKKEVTKNGGEITINSIEKQGTYIIIYLPIDN